MVIVANLVTMEDDMPDGLFPTNFPVPIYVLGPKGQPIVTQPEKLDEESSLRSAMSGYDSYLRSVFTIARYNPDALIQHMGYDELYRMMTFAAVRTPIDLKIQAALYKTPELLPAVASKKEEETEGDYEKAQEALDLCNYVINNIRNPETGKKTPFRAVLWNAFQAVPFGFSAQELIWKVEDEGKYKGKRTLRNVVHRPVEQIAFDLDEKTLEVLNVFSWTPQRGRENPVPVEKMMIYTYKGSRGLPWGNGDLRTMHKHYWSMDTAMRWWGIAQKKFGQPFLEGITSNASKIPKMIEDMTNSEKGASFAHTRQDEYKVWWPPSSSLDTFSTFCGFHQQQMMMACLGNTLTTSQGDGSSSFALGKTHQNSQNFFLSMPRHDMEYVVRDDMLEKIVVYNLGENYRRLTPRLNLGHWDDDERLLIAEVLEKLAGIGVFDPREDWVRDYMNIPQMPEGFDPNDDSLPLLPNRERVTVDSQGSTKAKPATTKVTPQAIEDAFQIVGDYIRESKMAGLTKEIREAAQ